MSPTSQTPERALVGTFWCSLFPSLISNTRKCPCGHFLVLAHLPSPSPSSRPPPLSLSFVSNTRTSPHRLILMFGHPSPSRPPERAHMGSFWCSRISPLSLPRL